ncbi:MAG: hypothetical protein HY675_21820, partial [Chloroflexi bacterium]|nr:hypothetical protein [Chloroflexota bacterium]
MVAEMSPYERVMTAVSLGVPDRIPVVPAAPAFAIRQAGYKFGEVLRDPG